MKVFINNPYDHSFVTNISFITKDPHGHAWPLTQNNLLEANALWEVTCIFCFEKKCHAKLAKRIE